MFPFKPIDLSGMTAGQGQLLVAQPGLDDKHFNHGVILLVDYEPGQEALGIVLNRQTNLTLNDVVDGLANSGDISIFSGGPVGRDRLIYLHTLGPIFTGSKEVAPGLFLGGEFDEVTEYISDGHPTDGYIRFYLGYSGWSAGQLEREIKEGSWAITTPLAPETMLTLTDNSMWHETVRSMGDKFKAWRYSPLNPMLN